jgi:hypothetical protein
MEAMRRAAMEECAAARELVQLFGYTRASKPAASRFFSTVANELIDT